jgi:phage tail-like protein
LTYGAHDSWVTGFEKELASSTAGSADPTVREQGAGAHDSWVSLFSQHMSSDPFSVSGSGADGSYMASPVQKPAIKPPASIMGQSRPDSANPAAQGLTGTPKHESWVNAFKKQLVKGQGQSWRAPVPASPPVPASNFKSGPVAKERSPSDKFVGQWNFRVKISGIPGDNCKLLSISGLSSETEPIEFKRSTRQYVEAIPGKYKYTNVELTKVMNLGGDSFSKWREEIEAGANALRTVTVYLHHIDLKGRPVMVLTLHDAWPIKWEFPELSGSSSDAATEKITLNVGRITRS